MESFDRTSLLSASTQLTTDVRCLVHFPPTSLLDSLPSLVNSKMSVPKLMHQFLRYVDVWKSRSRNPPRKQAIRNTLRLRNPFGFDVLEHRQMLAAVFLDNSTGDLFIAGNAGNDVATASILNSSTIRVSFAVGGNFDFPRPNVGKLFFLGYAGDDTLTNNTDIQSRMFGNSGNDTLIGGPNIDRLNGGPGNDILRGGNGADLLIGISGTDDIRGGEGADEIYGSATGPNLIFGDGGNDIIFGGTQADEIHAGDGIDRVYAGSGNDRVYSNAGGIAGSAGTANADLVSGGDGDDVLIGESGLDIFYGGNGNDFIAGGQGENRIQGQAGNDTIRGGNTADILFGNEGDDVLQGYGGNDFLSGGNGNDSLYGGSGFDTLLGEAGEDGLFAGYGINEVVNGGAGADRFLLNNTDSAADVTSLDAEIFFFDSTSGWTDTKIEALDAGLRALHHRTGSTTVFKDTLAANPMSIYLETAGTLGAGVRARNDWQWSGTWTTNGTITSETYTRKYSIANWSESSQVDSEWAALSIIHEISHSWDSYFEINQRVPAGASRWIAFANESGWTNTDPGAGFTRAIAQTEEAFDRVWNPNTQSFDVPRRTWWYRNGSPFARSYGTFNALEDWATVWESLFVSQLVANPDGNYSQLLPGKVAIVNQLLDAM